MDCKDSRYPFLLQAIKIAATPVKESKYPSPSGAVAMENESLATDLLDGMPAIARSYGCSERRGYYLAENKLIPAFKVGEKWCARKSTLKRHIESLEGANNRV
jgi:hypothetical protein